MASLNKVMMIGNVTRDIELRYTPNNVAVCNFSIALNGFKKQDGTQETSFVNVVAWKQTAEVCQKYINKGDPIFVEGRLQTRQYQNKEGNNVNVTEVVASSVQFLRSKSEPNQNQAQPQQIEDNTGQEVADMFDVPGSIPGEEVL